MSSSRKMAMSNEERVSVLRLSLQDISIGYLAGYAGGRNILTFDPAFVANELRPTLTLSTHPGFPKSAQVLGKPWITQQRLHPVLSNLLPEGALRELLAQTLKIHTDNEFPLLAHLGGDLPGALVATPLEPQDIPGFALEYRTHVTAVPVHSVHAAHRFSLAGVQLKFSMHRQDGRYLISGGGELGDWIIKMPSTRHRDVPSNEFTAMTLAGVAGVEIPEIRLVPLSDLTGLPDIALPDETHAYAIRRFDRDAGRRIHTEDFAQVFLQYAHEKYGRFNYEQVGAALYRHGTQGLPDIQQLARRLLVNILLANGDAHLKNWTLIYPDGISPRLAPAYDIVCTHVYIPDEENFALNLDGNKNWYKTGLAHFQRWAERTGAPWRAVKPALDDTLEQARSLWPSRLKELPMNPQHQEKLVEHWRALGPELRIG
jgi:serine/threonine-protein kinase HipA